MDSQISCLTYKKQPAFHYVLFCFFIAYQSGRVEMITVCQVPYISMACHNQGHKYINLLITVSE